MDGLIQSTDIYRPPTLCRDGVRQREQNSEEDRGSAGPHRARRLVCVTASQQ